MADQLSKVFAALADPTRRDLVARLSVADATVGDLAAPYAVSVQAISKHLQVLEDAGLVTKRREAHANWYATSFDERREMMMEHGTSGRKFAGQLVQLITASTGLDDFEWGVTLFAASLEVVKDVVYTMRFDEASALYGEFGDFWVGELAYIDAIYP